MGSADVQKKKIEIFYGVFVALENLTSVGGNIQICRWVLFSSPGQTYKESTMNGHFKQKSNQTTFPLYNFNLYAIFAGS